MRRKKVIICTFVVVLTYWFFGVEDYLFSRSFDDEFRYPLDVDINSLVSEVLSGNRPSTAPINIYPFRYISGSTKCSNFEKIDLLILVKSAIEHFEQRKAIRLTYGQDNAVRNKVVRTLFFIGTHRNSDPVVRKRVVSERARYADVIQMDFEDNYYNMTIKTMMSFRWAYEQCPLATYYLFTDDDMFISVPNLFKFVSRSNSNNRINAFESHLVAGYVFQSSPQRFWTSKWRVSLDEYPWNRWPPYVTAGAYVVSNWSMKVIYIGSAFVKHFRFDDIYLGIVAKKLGLELTHSNQFHFYKKRYSKEGYKKVIASHGYGDPHELIKVWKEQNELQKGHD